MNAATSASASIPASANVPAVSSQAATPRPKVTFAATTNSESETRPSPASRRPNRAVTPDPLSDRATSSLIRRTLCSQQLGDKARDAQTPIEELLPPLTSRNDVDLQLYALLAIIMREFVQSWYSKITTDETFVAEIIHIIAHCTRALEQRFREVDLESLLLDEIPDMLDKHITAYRVACQPVSQPPIEADLREIYHALCPLPHLAPVPREDDPLATSDQRDNEATYRQLLVRGILTILLPTEDLENPCLLALVEQIFSELIIGNVIANKAAQPWILYEGICIVARTLGERKAMLASETEPSGSIVHPPMRRSKWTMRGLFLSLIQIGIVFVSSIRLIATTLVMSSSLPSRAAATLEDDKSNVIAAHGKADGGPRGAAMEPKSKSPIMLFNIWTCAGNLIGMRSRMPWLAGFLSLLQYGAVCGPGRIAGLDGPVDRFLSHHIRSLFSPSTLPPLLRTLRGVLFPNNAPGQPALFPPSSEAELLALRRRAANALWHLLPKRVGRLYLGGRLWRRSSSSDSSGGNDEAGKEEGERQQEQQRMIDGVEDMLMVVSDEYCNKHLMYSILELILVRLMPELSERGVVELWDERLG